MASGSLGSLVVSLALDTARFQGDLGKAAAIADRRMRQIKSTIVNSLSGIGGAFALGGLFSFVRQAASAADEMKTVAERTGRTVESLSQLDYIAKRGNTSLEALVKSQEKLAKGMGATDDEGKAVAKVLTEIGLSADQLRSLSPDQQLDAIADAMSRVRDPTTRARIELTLFGKAGTELDAVLRSGAGGIRELREEADKFGITMSQLEADRLAKLDDQIERTTAQFGKLKTEIAGILAQPVASYLELVTKGLRGWQIALGFNVDEIERLNNEAARLNQEREALEGMVRAGTARDVDVSRLQAIKDELALIGELQQAWIEMPRLVARYEADASRGNAKAAAAAEAAAKRLEEEAEAAEKAAKAYAKYLEEKRQIIEQERFMNELWRGATPILDEDELERELDKTGDMIEKQAREDQVELDKIYAENAKHFGESMDQMSVFAEQAARNIQSHLADFLFDPFDKGIKGMLRGFVDVLRRMIAEAAAAKILEGLEGKMTGFLGGLFGGGGGGSGGLGGSLGDGGRTLPPGSTPTIPFPTFSLRGSDQQAGKVFSVQVDQTFHIATGTDPARFREAAAEIKEDTIGTMTELINGGAFAR